MDPVQKLKIVQFLLSVRLWTEIKLRSWIWAIFVLDMFGWLEKSKEEDTQVFEFENNLSRENLRLPARVTFGWVKPRFLKNNLNYPPKWFFSLQINAKFGWRKLFGLMWKCLWIWARFAPNWKKRHQLVQKDMAQPQLSHHNYKLSLSSFCCRYFKHPQPNVSIMWV